LDNITDLRNLLQSPIEESSLLRSTQQLVFIDSKQKLLEAFKVSVGANWFGVWGRYRDYKLGAPSLVDMISADSDQKQHLQRTSLR
jgi:hypothetical protein